MEEKNEYINHMNKSIKLLIKDALKITIKSSAMAKFLLRTVTWQKKAEKLRSEWEEKGVHVPPFMIASITSSCNLKCKGCYSHAQRRVNNKDITTKRWGEIFNEAKELGIAFILLAGGEPFMRKDVISSAGNVPEIIFPVFTNGTMIDENTIPILEKNRNIIPVISIEGYESETNLRRGEGVYNRVKNTVDRLKNKDVFFGVSITVSASNYEIITEEKFISDLVKAGCKVFFFVEFIPVENETKHLVISQNQREKLDDVLNEFRSKFSALFIAFPGDEKQFGGCLSSGRGFVHISSAGNIEPCPFVPYSDTNLSELSLKSALESKFLTNIRESKEHLSENECGCALFNKQEWVIKMLNNSK